MNRLIFGGLLASATFLVIGTLAFPTSVVMWLANTTPLYIAVRCILAIMLAVVLVTNPPRRFIIRVVMGVVAVMVAGWAVELIVANSMHLLDIVLFFGVGVAFGLEALELNEEEVDERTERLRHPEQYAPHHVVGPFIVRQWHKLLAETRNREWHSV